MNVPDELIKKFPVVLRKKLKSGEIKLQDEVEFEYIEILAYRCAERKKNDFSVGTKDDFLSNAEKGRKVIRGESGNLESKPEYYGVSLFQEKQELIIRTHLPKKNRKILKGYIYKEGGPILRGQNTHVCWWLYEDVDFSGFKIDDCED